MRTERTNTPLQALNLMNDVTFVEASRKFGERMYLEGGRTAEDRLAYGFEMATGRIPSARESEILDRAFAKQLQSFRVDSNAAEELLDQGDSSADKRIGRGELAAYAMTAGMILNLDETVTKQ